jgi:hypothetical protein
MKKLRTKTETAFKLKKRVRISIRGLIWDSIYHLIWTSTKTSILNSVENSINHTNDTGKNSIWYLTNDFHEMFKIKKRK